MSSESMEIDDLDLFHEISALGCAEGKQDIEDFRTFCKLLSAASCLQVRLIHGEAFGFPIKVNVEMIAMKTNLSDDKEFVLEVPTSREALTTAKHERLPRALAALISKIATKSLQELSITGFEDHRWVSLDAFVESFTADVWSSIQSLQLFSCVMTKESLSCIPSQSVIQKLRLRKCKLKESAIHKFLLRCNTLQLLEILDCGDYLPPLILKSDMGKRGSKLQRIHLDSNQGFDSCSSRGISNFRKAIHSFTHLTQLVLDDKDLPADLVERLILELPQYQRDVSLHLPHAAPSPSLLDQLPIHAPQFSRLALKWETVSHVHMVLLLNGIQDGAGLHDLTFPISRVDKSQLAGHLDNLLFYESIRRPHLEGRLNPAHYATVIAKMVNESNPTVLFWFLRALGELPVDNSLELAPVCNETSL